MDGDAFRSVRQFPRILVFSHNRAPFRHLIKIDIDSKFNIRSLDSSLTTPATWTEKNGGRCRQMNQKGRISGSRLSMQGCILHFLCCTPHRPTEPLPLLYPTPIHEPLPLLYPTAGCFGVGDPHWFIVSDPDPLNHCHLLYPTPTN